MLVTMSLLSACQKTFLLVGLNSSQRQPSLFGRGRSSVAAGFHYTSTFRIIFPYAIGCRLEEA